MDSETTTKQNRTEEENMKVQSIVSYKGTLWEVLAIDNDRSADVWLVSLDNPDHDTFAPYDSLVQVYWAQNLGCYVTIPE